MSVDGKAVASDGKLSLPAGAERIEIKFAALSLLVPAKVRYRYRLEGFDPAMGRFPRLQPRRLHQAGQRQVQVPRSGMQ